MLTSFPLNELAQRCAEETERFSRRLEHDTRFCFELLRRAMAEGQSEAFTHICQIYQQQVLAWVRRHGGFATTSESADYFANAALAQFYFGLRGSKFDRMPSLAPVLAYLKACVFTAVAQYLRDQHKAELVEIEETTAAADDVAADVDAALDAAGLWGHICRVLASERDQRLAQAAFVQGLKPRQILPLHPGLWRNEREITVELYRIRRLLRRDAELRRRLGLPPDPEA
jgi:hypothetical protein